MAARSCCSSPSNATTGSTFPLSTPLTDWSGISADTAERGLALVAWTSRPQSSDQTRAPRGGRTPPTRYGPGVADPVGRPSDRLRDHVGRLVAVVGPAEPAAVPPVVVDGPHTLPWWLLAGWATPDELGAS